MSEQWGEVVGDAGGSPAISSEGIPSLTNSERGQGGEVNTLRLLTTTTDENGGKWLEYTSSQGWTTATIAPNKATTTFLYDALGQLLASTDPDTMTTTYKYDGFGYQIERNHPDAGTTRWTYDNAGNLTSTQTQRQINDNTQTNYVYDYSRLKRTEYPKHPQLNVYYQYDSIGRLSSRTDLTGSITYQYDELGNIKQEDRQIILPNEEKTYNFTTRYNYDMLGRMTEIMYPDSEVVDYTYQLGQLTTIQGDNQTLTQEMKYDEYDHLTQMKHGNGYTTSYNYDTNRQWLKNSRTSNIYTSIGKRSILRDASYSYDRVGNIVAI